MKWVIYPLIAVSYILIVLSVIFSEETLSDKYMLSGVMTLIYGAVFYFFYELLKIK